MNIVVTGSLGYDYIMDFPGKFADRIMPDKIHQLSLSFLVDRMEKQFGGTAGNIAYTLQLLGVQPLILSTAGNDFAPYKKFLKQHKIETRSIVERKDVATGTYFVVTDKDDNQIGAFYEGAMKYNKELSLLSFRPRFNRGRNPVGILKLKGISRLSLKVDPRDDRNNSFTIIAPNDPVAMKRYVKECQGLHIPYLYDPAFQIDHFTSTDLTDGISQADIVIGNDYEISLIEKKTHLTHKELLQLAPIVITTLGSQGSLIETREKSLQIKPAKVRNTSDPTGAGDAYRAGFLAGFLRGFDLKACGQMGNVSAAYTVEKYGTQTHTFTKEEFIKRYEENYEETTSFN